MKIMDVDPKEPKHLIQFGDDFCEVSSKYKRKQERQWLINILFILGDQLCDVNDQTGSIDRVRVEDDPDYVIRVINNRTLPVYRAMVAKLSKSKPKPLCTANTREDKDIQSARASMKLLTNHWINLELDEGMLEITGWLVSAGNVFLKQFWNPNKGEVIEMDDEIVEKVKGSVAPEDDDDDKVKERKGKALRLLEKGKAQVPLGDTDLVIRNPFNCYPQPGKTRLEKMTMFCDSEFLTEDEVYDKYDKVVSSVNSRSRERSIYNISISDIINTGELNLEHTSDMIEVREMYILPCSKFPNGIKYKWAGDEMLGEPEECHELPFVHIGLIRVPGRFYFDSVMNAVIPMQIRWNELLSKIEMHNDLYNDPPIVIDPNVLEIDDWEARPGHIMEKLMTGGEVPWVMPVPQLDQAIFQEINLLDKQFEIIPILNKVSFGKDTTNARSGTAINFLQEKDDDILRPLVEEIEIAFTKVFKRDFRLCQANYNEDRGLTIVGPDNQNEWIQFTKADLRANIDVKCEPGSAMPRSIAAQQSVVLELMDRGFFIDQKTGQSDIGKIARYMEMGSLGDMYEDLTLDVDHAKRIVEKLKKGEVVQVQEWFNPNTHLYEINKFRKTTIYEDLSPEIQFLVDNYALQCTALIQPAMDTTPSGETVPLTENTVRPNTPNDPNSLSAVPPSAGRGSINGSPAGFPPPAGGQPMTQDEIMAILERIKTLKPDVYNQLQKMNPNVATNTIVSVMQAVKDVAIQEYAPVEPE